MKKEINLLKIYFQANIEKVVKPKKGKGVLKEKNLI